MAAILKERFALPMLLVLAQNATVAPSIYMVFSPPGRSVYVGTLPTQWVGLVAQRVANCTSNNVHDHISGPFTEHDHR